MKRVVKNGQRGSRQSHMNRTKFDPNKHKQEKERLPDFIFVNMTSLCCRRCCDIIQWKVDFGKYIPLERARKCNMCSNKDVAIAYHHICQACSRTNLCCAKCQKSPFSLEAPMDSKGSEDDDDEDGAMPEEENVVPKYAFVENESFYEELKPLKGLDVRCLEREISRRLKQEQQEELNSLSERKRRTALRKMDNKAPDPDDSDEDL